MPNHGEDTGAIAIIGFSAKSTERECLSRGAGLRGFVPAFQEAGTAGVLDEAVVRFALYSPQPETWRRQSCCSTNPKS